VTILFSNSKYHTARRPGLGLRPRPVFVRGEGGSS